MNHELRVAVVPLTSSRAMFGRYWPPTCVKLPMTTRWVPSGLTSRRMTRVMPVTAAVNGTSAPTAWPVVALSMATFVRTRLRILVNVPPANRTLPWRWRS